MALEHTNPKPDRAAFAPYNFVPLPEKIVPARDSIPGHNVYAKDTLTGWFDCELTTCSPTYVRGMLDRDRYARIGDKKPDQLTPEEKEERALFFSTSTERIEDRLKPTIPGSSLRGMIRAIVEIAGYGRMRWVANEPTFTFRAVAAAREDPLRDPYQQILGRFGANVGAGYLQKNGDEWFIRPAIQPSSLNLPERGAYLKVKERQIDSQNIPGFIRLNSSGYRPHWYPVGFDAEIESNQRGRYVRVTRITQFEWNKKDEKEVQNAPFRYLGALICSGNMKETDASGDSPRKNHALVLMPVKDLENKKRLTLGSQVVRDYLAGLSVFQKEKLTAWYNDDDKSPRGCLHDGAPVFYVADRNQVLCFGHSPNFRIPARLLGANRAATPFDFVPPNLREDARPDLAEAIFGWVKDKDGGPEGQRAGRVSFGDAHYVDDTKGVWLKKESITPHTLATPKPTTFQHYLAQSRRAGHDPDDKKSLAHYGSSPSTTEVRGHKLYWHKGDQPDIQATERERAHNTQLTQIVPLKPGVRFAFRIRFENLRPEELGALAWALMLPGEPGKVYRHKIGMGKPLGMGTVEIKPELVLTNRTQRYTRLFDGDAFDQAIEPSDLQTYVRAFDEYVREHVALEKKSLAEIERIRALLTMMEWREGTTDWLERTRYMEIEHGDGKINEYKERPVLPDPKTVVANSPKQSTRGTKTSPPLVQSKQLVTEYQHGTVKKYGPEPERAWGFITPDGGKGDVFVHKSQLRGIKTLHQGDRLKFKVRKGMKGLEAYEVQAE